MMRRHRLQALWQRAGCYGRELEGRLGSCLFIVARCHWTCTQGGGGELGDQQIFLLTLPHVDEEKDWLPIMHVTGSPHFSIPRHSPISRPFSVF